MAKTVPDSKFTEWKGLDRIQHVVHDMKCIWREMEKDDFGIDGEIEVVTKRDDGGGYRATGRFVKVQAKSGHSYVVSDSSDSFATPVKKDDLELWHNATFPVLFIVYHPSDDKLYAKEVKEYVRSDPEAFKPPYRVGFSKLTDQFDVTFFDKVAAYAGATPARLDFEEQEQFYSNLLSVTRLPRLYEAKSKVATADAVFSSFDGHIPPFRISGNTFRTFDDLLDDNSGLRQFTSGRVTKISGKDTLADESRYDDYIFLLNSLLKTHMYQRGVLFNKDFRRFFFRRPKEGTELKQEWTSIRTGKKAPPRTLVGYYEYGKERQITFWRHLAASIRFVPLGSKLYIQIVPKYFFTTDGTTPWDSELVGPYTTRIKSREFNPQVLNHVLFWSWRMGDGKSEIKMREGNHVLLEANCKPVTGLSPFALRLDPATYDEPVPSFGQALLFSEDDEFREDDDED